MDNFSKFAANDAYRCTADSFVRRSQMIGGTRTDPVLADTGAFLQENGDVLFRLYEPEAAEIELEWIAGHDRETMPLHKQQDGFFEGRLPYSGDPKMIGKRTFKLRIDGRELVHPRIPTIFRGHQTINYVDIPDPAWDDYLVKDVPHGALAYRLYWSETAGAWQRCMVYTPAEYAHTDVQYPVLYLHHGWGENETTWMFAAKAPQIMDNLIAGGAAKPFLVVTNENMPKLASDGTHGMDGYRRVLLNDCIPFIESEYRVKRDKWSRAIGGNSYGCMITSFIGFAHPELFGSLGLFSGGIRCKDFWPTYEQNHQLDWLTHSPEEVGRAYRLIYRGHGTVEYHDSPDHVQDDAFLAEHGISGLPCFVREFFPGGRHEWDTFGRDFAGFARHAFQ